MLKYFFIQLFLILFIQSFSQKISFYREDITFQLKEQYLLVSGDYYFKNSTVNKINQQIYFPIYSDSLINTFDSLKIFNYNKNQKVKSIGITESGVIFNIKIFPDDSVKLNISYKQMHSGSYAKYILTSTKSWGKPLKIANYFLIVNDGIEVQKFSYQPQKTINFNNKTMYEWHMVNFMPDDDFEVKFRIDNKK